MPEAFASFPGLQIRSADMVFSVGVEPSSCHVVAVPDAVQAQVGTLVLGDGDNAVSFNECAIDYAYSTPQKLVRGTRVHLRILDRRWKWRNMQISGRYNVRLVDGSIDPATKRSYAALFTILLDGLNESGYLIEPSLTMDAPEVNWNCASVQLELARLAEDVGCRIALGLDDNVRIVSNGSGGLFPPNGKERYAQYDQAPSNLPKMVKVVFGPTVYQRFVNLYPMAMESNGSLKRADSASPDQVSYAVDWQDEIPGVFMGVASTSRHLADRSVFRIYQIYEKNKAMQDGTIIETHANMLPLLPQLAQTNAVVAVTGERYLPILPFIIDSNDGYRGAIDGSGHDNMQVPWDFILDIATGVAVFPQPVYKVQADGRPTDPVMQLQVAHHAMSSLDEPPVSYSVSVNTNLNTATDAGTITLHRPDVHRVIRSKYSSTYLETGAFDDNQAGLDSLGQDLASSYIDNFRNTPMASMEWSGIIPYTPTGNLPQMRWIVGDSVLSFGYKNTFGPDALSHAEMRLAEEARRQLA